MSKVFDTPSLVDANRVAVRRQWHRKLRSADLDQLDLEGYHVVVHHELHEYPMGNAIRCILFAKLTGFDRPIGLTIDCPIELFNSLPSINDDGEVVTADAASD